jgi:uncharacterized repeat protein (TIGR03803 family)
MAFMRARTFCALLIAVIALLPQHLAARAKEKILYGFTGGTDGGVPSSSLIMDAAGNLYGTTISGGDLSQCSNYGCGTVFELTPSSNGTWRETVLHAFQGGSDGIYPGGNLLFDAAGKLYGTTAQGGNSTNCSPSGCGTVFQLSPNRGGSWEETILHSFQGPPDGAGPIGLTFDRSGTLYGTTVSGGQHGGTAYSLSPPKQGGESWTEKILYDGVSSNPPLLIDEQGNLYGTYYDFFTQLCLDNRDCGAVFVLEPEPGQWLEASLYKFLGGGNGGQPAAGVIRDGGGNLYGTAAEGGNNYGIIFELTTSGGGWKEKMIYNLCSRNNCADGAYPLAALVMDRNGNLYGTTSWGGLCISECGVVFKLARTNGGWKETVLHDFAGGASDGQNPQQSLILDAKGNLYGVANSSQNAGIVFEITP